MKIFSRKLTKIFQREDAKDTEAQRKNSKPGSQVKDAKSRVSQGKFIPHKPGFMPHKPLFY